MYTVYINSNKSDVFKILLESKKLEQQFGPYCMGSTVDFQTTQHSFGSNEHYIFPQIY